MSAAERIIDDAPPFDWRNPDYPAIFRKRVGFLQRIRAEPKKLPALKEYYREHPAQFVLDWGVSTDPRNVERGLPAVLPFVLFPKQVEWVEWVIQNWRDQVPGLTEKSRDVGISWLSVSLACTLCLFYENLQIGFGSRKEEYVDKIGAPKSLFWKARMFIRMLPVEFRGGWDPRRDAPHMRINFPMTGSHIAGEAGTSIGRGDRAAIYFVDEAAHLEQPELVEQSLSMTTNCRQDLSSVKGMNNPFAEKRWGGKIRLFIFDWRDDPRKDQAWYDKKKDELDPITLAQEVDRDYHASIGGIVIPYEWIRSAVDAHLVLNIKPTGSRTAALDIADQGHDFNSLCGGHGILIEHVEEWSGKNADIFKTVQDSFNLCDAYAYDWLVYDGDGLGAGARGDARIINETRKRNKQQPIDVVAFRGSGELLRPEGEDVKGRKNEDYFANRKAQAWWSLRTRFQKTHRWIAEGMACQPDEIISLSGKIKLLHQLCAELSQPTWGTNDIGKILINKQPENTRSPNKADSVMIRMAGGYKRSRISDDLLSKV